MLQPRQQYGLGSFVKKAVKGVTGAVKSAVSGVTGAIKDNPVLALAALNFAPALIKGGASTFFGGKNAMFGLPSFLSTGVDKFKSMSDIGKTATVFAGGSLLGGVLSKAEQGDPEAMQVTRDVGALRNYLTSGYTNLGYSAEEIPALVEKDLSEYTKLGGYATGGRVGFNSGSDNYESKFMKLVGELMEAGFSQQQAIEEARERLSENKANGGRIGYSKGTNRDEEQPIKELKDADPNLMAGPDWYMKRIEALMYEYDMDYDTAAEIAFDSNKYFELMPDEFATGGRVGYAGGGRDETPEEKMFREMKNAKVQAAIKLAGEKNIGIGKAMAITNEDDFNLKTGKYEGSDEGIKKLLNMKAMGGRVQYSNGTPSESDRVKELMDDGYTFGEAVKKVMEEQKQRENKAYGSKPEDNAKRASGIMNIPLNKNKAGVTELDMRENGGFIPPVGVKEKADDIPAMLSNNEFVFTADAVRGMGNGNVNVGAQRMYDMMKKLENRMA